MKLLKMSDYSDNSDHTTPLELLETLAEKVRTGEIEPKNIAIIVDTDDDIGVFLAQTSRGIAVFLLQCASQMLVSNYVGNVE